MHHGWLSRRFLFPRGFLVLGILLLSVPTLADVCTPEAEPNGALVSATPLGELGGSQGTTAIVVCSSSVCGVGAIDPVGDRDYYSFRVVGTVGVSIETSGDLSSDDTYIILYDASGSEITRYDDFASAIHRFSQITTSLTAGIYYVEVREDGDNATIPSYRLTVSTLQGVIAYDTQPAGTAWDIWIMNADGSNARALTADAATDWHPSISPDGTRVVFQSNRTDPAGTRGTVFHIWVMDIDGSNLRQVTATARNDVDPAWSPDSQFITFSRQLTPPPPGGGSGTWEVYVIRAMDPPGNEWRTGQVLTGEPWLSWGPGRIVNLDARSSQVVSSGVLITPTQGALVYVWAPAGQPCLQQGVPGMCGQAALPPSVRLSTSPTCWVNLTSGRVFYITADWFRTAGPVSCWTGASGILEFSVGDTKYDDNSGYYVITVIPWPPK